MRFLLALAIVVFAAPHAIGQDITDTVSDEKELKIAPDNPVVAAMDSLLTSRFMQSTRLVTDTQCLNVHQFQPGEVPTYPDSIISARLQRLNQRTPFDLVNNRYVEAYIDVYTRRRRGLSSTLLGLSHLYYPMFEEKLDRFDIPLEMKHLAIVESALNPRAASRAGAKGLWQFMYRTARAYDLTINSYIDERYDPYASTIAACRYFRFLYKMYGDWNLVLAAYNSGPGNVNKAIRRSGGERDYWKLRRWLPRETRGYVPAFIAVNYMMNYPAEHNLYPKQPIKTYEQVDTLELNNGPVLFSRISHYTGVSRDELAALNPACKGEVIPRMKTAFPLYLPRQAIGDFIANRDSIYYIPPKKEEEEKQKREDRVEQYVVHSGDVLGLIAERYGVRVSQILRWNSMRSSRIYPGQRLAIHVKPGANAEKNNSSANTEQEKSPGGKNHQYYRVESGDTLWDIAAKYRGVSVNEIKKLNRGINFRYLKPGQRIKISEDGS